jgi:hypothetical protein
MDNEEAINLTKSLQLVLTFVSDKANFDVDLLITIQTFIQNITINLENYLDLGIIQTLNFHSPH